MTASPLVVAVQVVLRSAGYRDIPTPFRLAGVEFEFTAAMRGREGRALDLVLLIDTTTGDYGDRDAARVRQRIESLSRALDVTGSRYVVTAVLVGAPLVGDIELLSDTCRVLFVEPSAVNAISKTETDDAQRQLEDRIRVLLPLSIPDRVDGSTETGPAMEQLAAVLPRGVDQSLLVQLIEAAGRGETAVTEVIASRLGNSLLENLEEPE